MKVTSFLSGTAVLICTAALTGCAFTSEKVALNPTVKVTKQNIGHGKPVAVRVIDARPSTSLGGRASGYGPAGNISLASDLKKTVTRSVDKTLAAYGFKAVNNATNLSRKLAIRIIALDYHQRAGFWVAGIRINSTLEATARNHGRSYDKTFRTTEKHGAIFTPTSSSDSAHINAALSTTLTNLASDKRLFRFLAR